METPNARKTHLRRGNARRSDPDHPGLRRTTSPARRDLPYPIYAKWAEAYKRRPAIGLNYQSIGSGGGIKQIKAKTVDFGASDMPLKPEELDEGRPARSSRSVIGGVVPVVNLAGVKPGS